MSSSGSAPRMMVDSASAEVSVTPLGAEAISRIDKTDSAKT